MFMCRCKGKGKGSVVYGALSADSSAAQGDVEKAVIKERNGNEK